MVEIRTFQFPRLNMSEPNTLANGIKVAFLYGIAGPEEEPDLYQRIHAYAFAHKLVPEDFVGREPSFYLLRQFFRKIEELAGFKHLDYEGAWDPETREDEAILVLARRHAPTDEEEIEKIKRAVEAIKRELELEETEKWYVEDSDHFDRSTLPKNLDPPPRFT